MTRQRVTCHSISEKASDEAAKLLQSMRFSHENGAYARGEHVVVSIDTQWNDDSESISALITCYAFGHVVVDWSGLMLFVCEQSSESNTWVAFLSHRGQARVASLPPGEYRVHPLSREVAGREPVIEPVRSRRTVVTRRPEPATKEEPESTYTYTSADGLVTATVTRSREGRVSLAFRASDPDLAGRRVNYRFVGKSGKQVKTVKAGEVELALLPTGEVGADLRTVHISARCELVFNLV